MWVREPKAKGRTALCCDNSCSWDVRKAWGRGARGQGAPPAAVSACTAAWKHWHWRQGCPGQRNRVAKTQRCNRTGRLDHGAAERDGSAGAEGRMLLPACEGVWRQWHHVWTRWAEGFTCILIHSPQRSSMGTSVTPILQTRKLMLREDEHSCKSHSTG